jgi:ketosteroid isomerase-like protein
MEQRAESLMIIAREHELKELSLDFDGLMDTLVADPIYFWFPQRLRVQGRAAVRAMYERIEPLIAAMAAAIKSGARAMHFVTSGENQIAAEVEFPYAFPDGAIRKVRIAAFVDFEDGKMVGETQYVDQYLAAELDRLLGRDFLEVTGVSTI